jgi:hypothetical protein
MVAPLPALAQSTDRATRGAQRGEERTQAEERQRRNRSEWRLYLSSGAFYSTGDYGTDVQTRSITAPFTVRVRKGPLRLSATTPFHHIRGSRRIIAGDEGPIIDDLGGTTERETRSGFGDLSLRARYRLEPKSWKGVELDLLARVKLPTGSERKRLSTGETDYGIGGELSYTRSRIQPFAAVQYRINGDRPDRDYRNTWATSVGASTRLGRRVNVSLSYDYSGSRVRGRSGSHSIDGSLSTPLSRKLILSGFGSVGLSKRSDDFTIGSVLTLRAF